MVILELAYKYRAYPSENQQNELSRQMSISKEIYNLLLVKAKDYYKQTGKTLTEYRMNTWLTQMKKEIPELNELHSQVLQNISKRISDAYKSFFRRCKEKKAGKNVKVGFPRFKKAVFSLTYPQIKKTDIERKKVHLSKIGDVNFVNHREIEGVPKTLTVKKTKAGEWFITISVEKEGPVQFSNGKEAIGIDLGLTNYIATSNGKVIDNIKIPKKKVRQIKRLQRIKSKKKLGSHNRRKAVKTLAKAYDGLINEREDFIHQLAHNLTHSYSFIGYERLNIAGMMKNHHLARTIGEASWGRLVQYLQYEAESAGCVVFGIDPRGTTQECSGCGYIKEGEEKLKLEDRTYHCNNCGLTMDRDENASKVILRRAMSQYNDSAREGRSRSHASGDGVRPSHMKAVVEERGTIFGAVPR